MYDRLFVAKRDLTILTVVAAFAGSVLAESKAPGAVPASPRLSEELPSYHFENDRRTTFVIYQSRVGDQWISEATYGTTLTKSEKQLVFDEIESIGPMTIFKPRVPISGRILFVELAERRGLRKPVKILEMAVTARRVVTAWDDKGAPKRWIALSNFQRLLTEWDRN